MLKLIPLLIFAQTTSTSAAPPNSCIRVIEAWRDAVDCQTNEAVPYLTWSDGFSQWPGREKGKWAAVSLSGPCPKYSTTLREWRPDPVAGNRQTIRLKVISRKVAFDGRYSGDYMVTKETFTCERRDGQWRIFSQEVTKRVDLINHAAARRFEATGGWDP